MTGTGSTVEACREDLAEVGQLHLEWDVEQLRKLVADGVNDPALVAWFHSRLPRHAGSPD